MSEQSNQPNNNEAKKVALLEAIKMELYPADFENSDGTIVLDHVQAEDDLVPFGQPIEEKPGLSVQPLVKVEASRSNIKAANNTLGGFLTQDELATAILNQALTLAPIEQLGCGQVLVTFDKSKDSIECLMVQANGEKIMFDLRIMV